MRFLNWQWPAMAAIALFALLCPFAVSADAAECYEEGFETGTLTSLPWATGSPPANWATATDYMHTGSYSARSGAIGNSQTTYLQVTLNRGSAGNVSFYRKVSSESGYDKLRFYIDGVEKFNWSGNLDWASTSLYPVSAGSHVYRWEYTKDSSGSIGSDAAWIDDIVFPADESFETGGFATWPWQTGADANWAAATDDKCRGSYSAKAGAIADGQSTYLQVTLTRAAGNVGFCRKVSCEPDSDKLRFYIDGDEQESWSGEQNWSWKSYTVSAGTHTYKWEYVKDGSGSGGSDTAWIDEVVFPPPPPPPATPSNPGASTITDDSICWTWNDNSSDESGFKVWADSGAGPPATPPATTDRDATSWIQESISANSQYCFQVASTNGISDSARTTNITRYTLPLAPIYGSSGDGAINCDKAPGEGMWYLSGTTFTFTAVNGFGTGPSRAKRYLYVWDNSPDDPSDPSWSGALSWTSGTLVRTVSATGNYYLHLRACNYSGTANTTSLTIGPYKVDVSAPETPIVTDDGTYQAGTTQLHASWSSPPDSPSGLAEYKYAIGTTPIYTTPVIDWKSAGANTDATESSLSLDYGTAYYWYVKARDVAGNWSGVGTSDGITPVENSGMSIGEAKALPDGDSVGLDSKAVTAIRDRVPYGKVLYVEETNRCSGIRVEVESMPEGVTVGGIVNVGGAISTNSDGEKLITGIVSQQLESTVIPPVGMNGSMLGGGPWAYDSGSGAGQQGIEGASGLNNIGLLVRAWGKVVETSSGPFASWNLDTNPGWNTTTGSQWAFGTPTGGGGVHGFPDPTSGHTGTNVYGVNLAGDYARDVLWYYLTTGAIDCSTKSNVGLSFWRWLNTDFQTFAYATVDASNNGTSWTRIWDNGTTEIKDSAWTQYTYSISSVADGKSTVYIRWGYQVASGAWAYSGWNIDDIELSGTGNTCTIDDGSGAGVLLVYPPGLQPPALDDNVAVTGISSCHRDGEGKLRPMVLVTEE